MDMPVEFEFKIKPSPDSELSHYIQEFQGQAIYWDDEQGEDIVIGEIVGHRIDLALARHNELSLEWLADSVSPSISDFWNVISHDGVCYLPGRTKDSTSAKLPCVGIVFVDEVRVPEAWRGKGIGTQLMMRMSEMIDLEGCLVGLKAWPLAKEYDDPNDKDTIQRVKKFYEKLGFQHAGEEFMTKDADECGVRPKRKQPVKRKSLLESGFNRLFHH